MKIAVIFPISPEVSLSGGLEQFGRRLAAQLVKEGHKPVIFTNRREGGFSVEGVEVEEVKAYHPGNAYFFSPELFFALRRSDAQILHCNGYNNLFTLTGILAKKPGQKLIISLHNSGSSSSLRRLLLKFFDAAINFLSARIDLVIYSTDAEYREFSSRLKIPKEKTMIMNYGLDMDLLTGVEVKKKKGLIVSAGRLIEEKGFGNLIRGFAAAAKKNKEAKLRIIGDGPDMQALQELAAGLGVASKVEFYGTIPLTQRERYIAAFKEAEIMALLCSPHTNPQVIIEAIAAGMPVVATSAGAPGHYAREGYAVGVDNVSDSEEVGRKLLMVLKNPSKFVSEKKVAPSWKEYAHKMSIIYKNALKK